MKPYKLLACLVTLQFTCGLTLQAAALQDFRQWTDTKGRTITARLVDVSEAGSVKIERQDGRFFTVALTTFSAEDQDYVKIYRKEHLASASGQKDGGSASLEGVAATGAPLAEPAPSTWVLLNSGGSQPASLYNNTHLDEIIEKVNRRLGEKAVKTSSGLPFKVRTEPSDLANRIQISGNIPNMSLAAFVREVARVNDLVVKTDAAGMVVLVDKTQPVSKPVVSFFGVAVNTAP